VQVFDLDNQPSPVGTDTVGGMGVAGNFLILEEGGRLWKMDLTMSGPGSITWLENPPVTNGEIAFDANSVVFETQQGITREVLADHSTQLLSDLIADGGY